MHIPLQRCAGSKDMENKPAGGLSLTEHGASCRLLKTQRSHACSPHPPSPAPQCREGSHLEDAGSIWSPPGIEEVVLTGAHKPLSYRHKLGISFPNKKNKAGMRIAPLIQRTFLIPFQEAGATGDPASSLHWIGAFLLLFSPFLKMATCLP